MDNGSVAGAIMLLWLRIDLFWHRYLGRKGKESYPFLVWNECRSGESDGYPGVQPCQCGDVEGVFLAVLDCRSGGMFRLSGRCLCDCVCGFAEPFLFSGDIPIGLEIPEH